MCLPRQNLTNLLPVSNLPFVSKIAEKAVIPQVLDHCSKHAPLPSNQSSYRHHHSTETALLRVQNDILLSMDRQEVTLLVLLDLRGAYHLRRKTGLSGWKIKWYAPFRSELSGKSGRSCEAIHISRSFRFSWSVCEPFQLPALFKIFLARQNKMADHGGNEGEFENC